MSLLALTVWMACDPVTDDFKGPSDQWDGLISEEEADDEVAGLEGDIDTGAWLEDDPPDEDPPEDDPPEDDPEPPICTEADLLFAAEIVDADGAERASSSSQDDLYFVGRTLNPCDSRVILTTASPCLVQRWEIKDDSGDAIALKPDCDKGAWDWELDPGDEVLQTSSSRRLGPGDYTLTVRFNADPFRASKAFTVE